METGAKRLMLTTVVDNLSAQHLYERKGWKRDETFYNYHLDI